MTEDPAAAVATALDALCAGGLVVIRQDRGDDSRGALIGAASLATPESVNFMVRSGGVIGISLTEARAVALDLVPQRRGADLPGERAAWMGLIDAREGVTTGISAADRALTIALAADPASGAEDFVQPGHVRPFVARPGGALARPSLMESGVDLVRLAGLPPACAVAQLLNDDGSMALGRELAEFAARHRLPEVTTVDVVAHLLARGGTVERVGTTTLPTDFGEFDAVAYRSQPGDHRHVALVKGEVGDDILVRVQRACVAGAVLRSSRCACRELLDAALARIGSEGGVLVHIFDPEGHLFPPADGEPEGLDIVDVGIGAQILRDLGVRRMRLLTASARRPLSLDHFGLSVSGKVDLRTGELLE